MTSTRVLVISDVGDRAGRPNPEMFASPGFVADARNLLAIDQATLDAIVAAIDRHTFVAGDELQALIAEHVEDDDVGTSLRNLFWHLTAMRRRADDGHDFDLKLKESLRKGLSESFDAEDLDEVISRVIYVSSERHALARQEKAEKLTGLTGTTIRHFNLITDLRPVFDEDRDVVQGVVPVTTLVLALDDEDGLPHVIRVRLSSAELDELSTKAQLAQKKLAEVTKLMGEKSIPVPTV